MMEKITKYKNYLLGVIGVLLTLTMSVGIKYLMKSKYEELPEVKLRDINNKKSFAIMIQNGDTYEEFTSADNTWPGDNYKFKEAKCINDNGELVENVITFANGKAKLKTNQTVYCTLYFDIKQMPEIVKQLREKDKEVSQGIEHLSPKSNQGGMYRYQGTDDVPNWICFGTIENCGIDETDDDYNYIPDGIDKYMYRIIGITDEGQMYLIKETFLKEGDTRVFKWNTNYLIEDCIGETCEWPNVDLYKRLNGETSNGNPIFVDNSEYEYMTQGTEWYKLIEEHNWMYGDMQDLSLLASYKGQPIYEVETGQADTLHYGYSDGSWKLEKYRWTGTTPGKISLMYLHDYYYSYYDGKTEESRGYAGSFDKLAGSWIFFQKDGFNTSPPPEWFSDGIIPPELQYPDHEWVVTREGKYYDHIETFCLRSQSNLYHATGVGAVLGVRPVFYLDTSAKIASGSGTKSDPFILEIKES